MLTTGRSRVFSTLKMEVTRTTETSVLTRLTRRHIPDDGILQVAAVKTSNPTHTELVSDGSLLCRQWWTFWIRIRIFWGSTMKSSKSVGPSDSEICFCQHWLRCNKIPATEAALPTTESNYETCSNLILELRWRVYLQASTQIDARALPPPTNST
jgi:hypothetical protein